VHIIEHRSGTRKGYNKFRAVGLNNCVLCVHRVAEGAEVVHVRAEDEVAELRERKEDREEHDGKAEEVHRSTVDGRRQSTQRPREVHVFE